MNKVLVFIGYLIRVPTYLLFTMRLLLSLPLWLIYLLFSTALDFIGLFVVPLAIAFGGYIASPIYGNTIYSAPNWLWLWGNDEEGYDSPNVRAMLPSIKNRWLRMYVWAAIRNSTSNLRFINLLNPPQRATAVKWITVGKCILVWQGVLSRLIWNNANRVTGAGPYWSIGWKYEPEQADATGWQAYGVGFACRLVRGK